MNSTDPVIGVNIKAASAPGFAEALERSNIEMHLREQEIVAQLRSTSVNTRVQMPMQWRELRIDPSYIDEDKRTFSVAFSSEEPVDRFFGMEILDHSPGSVRLDRFQNGAGVLVDHDTRDHVGTVESVSLSDGVGRAIVRLGRSERASEILQDVVDRIRHSISVGYKIYRIVRERAEGEVERFRAVDWEPLELSFVAVPADFTVGVGRAVEPFNLCTFESAAITRQLPMADENQGGQSASTPAETTRSEPQIDVKAEREKARRDEQKRIRTIVALGAKFDMSDDAQRFVDEERTPEEFQTHILDQMAAQPREPVTKLDLTPREVKRYSLLRLMRGLAGESLEKTAPFEYELSVEIAERLGKDAQGAFVPYDILEDTEYGRNLVVRAPPMDTGDNADLVATDHLAASYIDALRSNTVVLQAGAVMLQGLVGNVDIPKAAGTATHYWVAEDGEPTDSEVPTTTVSLSPKTLAGAVPITRRLLLQSAPSAEALVRNDLVQGNARALDLAALEGTGASNQPLGIVNQTGVLTQAIADITNGYPTWAEAVGFETQISEAAAEIGTASWVMRPSIRGGMKTTPKDAGSGMFVMEGDVCNGYAARVSQQISAQRIMLGYFGQLLIGMWGVLDIVPDRATKVASGGLVMRTFQDVDIAVRHAQSFCINA